LNLGFGLKPEQRRRGVLVLRLQGLSEMSIARTFGVSQPTVRAGPAVVAPERREGTAASRPAVVIGESVALYDYLAALALREHDALLVGPHAFSPQWTAVRMQCLKVAMLAEKAKIRLLKEVGLLTRYPFERPCDLPTANEIRARLSAAGVFDICREETEPGASGRKLIPETAA